MPWTMPIDSRNDVVAIHAALVPTADGYGEILLFGGDNHFVGNNQSGNFRHGERFHCNLLSLTPIITPDFDVFCCGHAFLGDGRLLIAGGTERFNADVPLPLPGQGVDHHGAGHWSGHRRAAIYNSNTQQFEAASDMNFSPGETTGGGRWYPTLCTLASGEVFAFGGHPSDSDQHRHINDTPERYQPLTNSWMLLPRFSGFGAVVDSYYYCRMHLLPDGTLYFPMAASNGGNLLLNGLSIDPYTGATRDRSQASGYSGYSFPSVMLPLTPDDGYKVRVLLAGQPTSKLIELPNSPTTELPAWRTVTVHSMGRFDACVTILPTGNVLLTGGTWDRHSNGALDSELYRTPIDLSTGLYSSELGFWEPCNDPAHVLRNYHSTALLMPDGRVWTGGGNIDGVQPDSAPGDDQKKIEIYSPSYPEGPRPRITSCPKFLAYGDSFQIEVQLGSDTDALARINRAILIRCGSSTHAFNPDQRAVLLRTRTDGNIVQLEAPPSGNIAPPGNYMLFVIDHAGRPCEWAKFVRVGGHLSMFANRSHYSKREVETSNSVIDALYVVFDGFTPAEVSSGERREPSFRFQFTDGSDVRGLTASRTEPPLLEAPGAGSNYLAQRITMAFHLQFSDPSVFDGIDQDEGRRVVVTVRWGASETSGQVYLIRQPHAYSLDGPVPWLSVDLRVVKVNQGTGSLAGLPYTNTTTPTDFLHSVISQFRRLADNNSHPFKQIGTDSASSVLELAPTVRGARVDNFAFAKVRLRAPVDVSVPVRVMFRLFTTAGTHLEYDDMTMSSVYARTTNTLDSVALMGRNGSEVISIPFFASPRSIDPVMQMDLTNQVTLRGGGATESIEYVGCYLDLNHNSAIMGLMRAVHQCLVAEIFDPSSRIPLGSTPSNNDQLAQRNLAIVASDNPGGAAAHTIAHTFELQRVTQDVFLEDFNGSTKVGHGPDQLFIHWHDLPRDTFASIYIPELDIDLMLAYASLRLGTGSLMKIDEHTIRFVVGDVSYLPLVGGSSRKINPIGMIKLQLPPTVKEGQHFRVSVHQIAGETGAVVGSFELSIPVSRSELMVEQAEREFAVMRQIGAGIATSDRWSPVFNRYLDVLQDRVQGLGGNIETKPGNGHDHAGPHGSQVRVFTGKIRSIQYDHFGDFDGFVLENSEGEHQFFAREKRLYQIVHEAATNRLTVKVSTLRKATTKAVQVMLEYT
jgi:hypothetical protein